MYDSHSSSEGVTVHVRDGETHGPQVPVEIWQMIFDLAFPAEDQLQRLEPHAAAWALTKSLRLVSRQIAQAVGPFAAPLFRQIHVATADGDDLDRLKLFATKPDSAGVQSLVMRATKPSQTAAKIPLPGASQADPEAREAAYARLLGRLELVRLEGAAWHEASSAVQCARKVYEREFERALVSTNALRCLSFGSISPQEGTRLIRNALAAVHDESLAQTPGSIQDLHLLAESLSTLLDLDHEDILRRNQRFWQDVHGANNHPLLAPPPEPAEPAAAKPKGQITSLWEFDIDGLVCPAELKSVSILPLQAYFASRMPGNVDAVVQFQRDGSGKFSIIFEWYDNVPQDG